MTNWVSCATIDECPPGASLERAIDGRIVAVFNVNGELYALDGICPHQGGPLGQGQLHGQVVTCPWHGWQFNVRDGKSLLNPQIEQEAFQVRVDDGEIFLYV